jgi:hypothetical protein
MTENPPASLAEQKEPKWTLKQIESMLDYVPEHVSFDTFSGQNTVDELRQLFRAHMPDGQPRDISEFPLAPSLAEGGEQKARAESEELSTLRGKVAMLEQALKTSAALTGEIVKQRDQLTKERDRWETAALKVRSSGRAEGTEQK